MLRTILFVSCHVLCESTEQPDNDIDYDYDDCLLFTHVLTIVVYAMFPYVLYRMGMLCKNTWNSIRKQIKVHNHKEEVDLTKGEYMQEFPIKLV